MTSELKKLRYPELFYKADNYSNTNQKVFFILPCLQLLLTVLIAASTLLVAVYDGFEYATRALLLFLLCAVVVSGFAPFLKRWYLARSLAESIKTISWRYVMNAAPFNINDELAAGLFVERIRELLEENKDMAVMFATDSSQGVISDSMHAVRGIEDKCKKKEYYLKYRVEDQEQWYLAKAKKFSKMAFCINTLMIVCIIAAILLSYCNSFSLQIGNGLINLLVVTCVALLTWTSTKRYRDLSNSYSWTNIDVILLHEQFKSPTCDVSNCVADAENAFSREHASWLARKDN